MGSVTHGLGMPIGGEIDGSRNERRVEVRDILFIAPYVHGEAVLIFRIK